MGFKGFKGFKGQLIIHEKGLYYTQEAAKNPCFGCACWNLKPCPLYGCVGVIYKQILPGTSIVVYDRVEKFEAIKAHWIETSTAICHLRHIDVDKTIKAQLAYTIRRKAWDQSNK